MLRAQIEKTIQAIFGDKWDYTEGNVEYFRIKAQQLNAFADDLSALTSFAVDNEPPANLQNFYRLEVCLTPRISTPREALTVAQVLDAGEVIWEKAKSIGGA